jgi:hypothetical protein
LVRKGYFYGTAAIEQEALAAKAGVEARVHGAVNEILFLVAQLLEEVLALVYINVAGAAGANAAAVVVQVDIVHQGHFQDAVAGLYVLQCYRLETSLLEIEFNGIHQSFVLFGCKSRPPPPEPENKFKAMSFRL